MKINVFKTQCHVGSKVAHRNREEHGIVKKVSDCKALVAFADGDVEWIEYHLIELL